jgi:HAD superfamily hydrolase (TIGR01509 family)
VTRVPPAEGLIGVLLDVDGTLVDSNDAHAQAWHDALAEAGFRVPHEWLRRLIGMGGDKLLAEVAGLSDEEPLGRLIAARRTEIFLERELASVRPLPGARSLLERLRADGLRLVVASSARDEELDALLDCAGVQDLIEARTSSSDVERSKPDPDIVVAALRQLGGAPPQAVMVGDTPYDVEAATRAGVAVVAFRSGGWDDGDLEGALAVYDGPADLLLHFEESPFARHRIGVPKGAAPTATRR